jgi:hypothetical protein
MVDWLVIANIIVAMTVPVATSLNTPPMPEERRRCGAGRGRAAGRFWEAERVWDTVCVWETGCFWGAVRFDALGM